MFTGPLTGDDFDPQLVTRSEVNANLQNYATNVALGEVQATALQGLTTALGNSTIATSLDQRFTAELALKLEMGSLTPYALETSITQLSLQQLSTNTALQNATQTTSLLQSSTASSLSLKADQSSLDSISTALSQRVTSSGLETALIPYATATQTAQSLAVAKGVIEATAASTYATQQQVTNLSIDLSAKTSQADVSQALTAFSTKSETSSAILTASALLDGQLRPSITALQVSAGTLGASLDLKASQASVLQLASDLSGKIGPSELVLALSSYATTSGLTALQGALTQVQASIPSGVGVTVAELTALLLGYTTQTTTNALQTLLLQLQSDLASKVTQATVNSTLASYVTTSALQTAQGSIQASINAILASMASTGGSGTTISNGALWLNNSVSELLVGSIIRNLAVLGPLSLSEENGGNTLLLTADCFSKAEANTLLAQKQNFTENLVLASLSALNNRLVLKAGVNGLVLQNTAGTQELLSIDALGNSTFSGSVYADNLAQKSLLNSYALKSDLFLNLSNYYSKETFSATEIGLSIGKFRIVVSSGGLEIRQLHDFGLTPTDAYLPICGMSLADTGSGSLTVQSLNAANVYTKTAIDSLLSTLTTADSDLSARIDNLSGAATGGLKVYEHNYGLYKSGVITHPFALQLGVSTATPPSSAQVLLSMDVETGVAVNTSLTVVNNLSVGGALDCPNIYTKSELNAIMTTKYPMTDSTNWQQLGLMRLNSASLGGTMKICTNKSYNAQSDNMLQATLELTRSGGSSQAALPSGNVNFACTLRGSLLFPEVRVVQTSIQTYQFWVKLHSAAGVGFFTVVTSGSFEFSGLIQTAAPSGIYINPLRLFAHNVDGLHTLQVAATSSLLKLKGGASGVQLLGASNELLLEASTAAVSILQNVTVLTNTSNTSFSLTNSSGSGFSSSYMNAATVASQLFVGGGFMFVGTNTNHPLRFATNRFVNATSMSIETNGSVVVNGSVVNSSDSKLKDNQQLAPLTSLKAILDAVDVKTYDRNDLGGQPRFGFVAQDLEAVCTGNFAFIVGQGTKQSTSTAAVEGQPAEAEQPIETFKTVDYSRLVCVLWGVVKDLKARIEVLEAR